MKSDKRSVKSGKLRSRPLSGYLSEEEETKIPLKVHQKCLLDVLNISLSSGDLKSAVRLSAFTDEKNLTDKDIRIGSFIVHIGHKPILNDKFELKLQVERNLDKAFSHRVPDLSVKGALSKLHSAIDLQQYMFIRGMLTYNFGESIDDLQFQVPTNEYTDPSTHTVLTGNVWTGIFMDFELQDVIIDLLLHRETSPSHQERKLARVNLFKSRLIFESFSDSSKDIDLVSQEILLTDLRFEDYPANKKANVFNQILQPMRIEERNNPLQVRII